MKKIRQYIIIALLIGLQILINKKIYASQNVNIYEEEQSISIRSSQLKIKVNENTYNSLKISFNKVEGATGYEIYRSTSSNKNYKKIAKISGTAYADKNLTCGKTYYYKVRAFNELEYSSFSKVVYKKVIPSKVSIKSIKSKTYNSIYVSWNKVSGASGYAVYRSTMKNGKYVKITVTNKLTFTDKYLKNNKTYYYKVRAYKTVNGKKVYGKYSNVYSVKTKLATPKFSLSQSGTYINVKIKKSSGTTGYVIYRATSLNGKYTKVAATKKLNYKDKNIVFGKTYYYKIKAYKIVGYKKYYSSCTAPIKITKSVPKPIMTLSKSSNTSIQVKWNKISGVSGYEIYMSQDGTSFKNVKNITKASTIKYTKSNLMSENKYYFKLRAYKTINGVKKYSTYSSVKSLKLNKYHKVLKLKCNCLIASSMTKNSKVLGEVSKNQVVVAYDKQGSYYKIKFNGKDGYINGKYVKEYNDAKVIGISNINQFSNLGGKALPMGCEVTSLTVVLQYLGFKSVTKNLLADKFLPMGKVGSTDPNFAFVGTPYSKKPYGCYAPVIVEVAQDYLKSVNNNSYEVNNLTGMEIEELYKEIDKGNPLIMWITCGKPYVQETFDLECGTKTTKEGEGNYNFTWYGLQHCVALAGYNKKKGTLIIADVAYPGELKEYTISSLKSGYNKLGKQVVSITKK